jgi:tripartite-type tricarboxylate transporter receptor subunit TctC
MASLPIAIASAFFAAAIPISSMGQPTTDNTSAYPAKVIKIVVPLSAGGPTDTLARIIAQPLSKRLGQPVVIENRPGAGGNIGAEVVAKAPPDGYTLFLGTSGPLSINSSLYGKLNYDPIKDFSPISLIASAPFVIAAGPSLPLSNIAQLIEAARHSPAKLNAGSVTGSAAHLATELFKSAAHIDIAHIPYKGAAPATNDLIAGQIDLSFASTPGVLPQIRAGKLRALAVTSPKRLPQLPAVPTVAESGFPGFEASVWYGLVAPSNTPPKIIQRLSVELSAILNDLLVREQLTNNYFVPIGSTPEQFENFIKSETGKWGAIVKSKGLKAE